MKTMTATEASRSFAALLDEVERGESVVVTRAGKRIALIAPASNGNGAGFVDLITSAPIDVEFAGDVESVRELLALDDAEWPAD